MKILMMPVRREPVQGSVPQIWATNGSLASAIQAQTEKAEPKKPKVSVLLTPEVAFYRKYTEGILRRYATLRMESGRVPSMLGKTMFRGKASSYRVRGFDDVVIFVHDVEKCVRLLSDEQQRLIYRVAVQEYTFGEAAQMMRISLRSAKRWYTEAVDELTGIFLQRKLLERIHEEIRPKTCQEGSGSSMLVSYTPE